MNLSNKVLRSDINFVKLSFVLRVESSSFIASTSGNKVAIAFSKGSLSPSAAFSKLGTIPERLLDEPNAELASDTSVSKEKPDDVNALPKSFVILVSNSVC